MLENRATYLKDKHAKWGLTNSIHYSPFIGLKNLFTSETVCYLQHSL